VGEDLEVGQNGGLGFDDLKSINQYVQNGTK